MAFFRAILNPREDFREVNLKIIAMHFDGFDDHQDIGNTFATLVGTCE